MKTTNARNSLLLLITASIWGMSFVSQSKGMEYMKPFTFIGVRSLIGALALLVFILVTGRLSGRKGRNTDLRTTVKAGIWCGILLTVASMFQQYGIVYTTVGKAGFITTLYIIFVPAAGIFFRKRVAPVVWCAAVMAAVGMYLLCMTESFTVGKGDMLVFVCAVFFTAHIMVIDYYAPKTDGVAVSCIQFAVCGVICLAGSLLFDQPSVSQITSGMGTLLYAGVLSCGVAYTFQIVGQKGLNPTVAALILSLESVVSAVSGWAAYRLGFLTTDQSLTIRQIAGCVIVFTAVIMVQLPGEWFQALRPGKLTGSRAIQEQDSSGTTAA